MRALIIEPQVFTSFMIEDALRDAGYTSVDLATTEEEAVSAAAADPPDLVTAAVELRSGNGLDAVRKIRLRQDVPVLFITQHIAQVKGEEPDALIVRKPFSAADLPPAIAEAKHRNG